MKTNKFLKLSTVLLFITIVINSVQAASLFSTEKGKESVVIGLRGGINWSKWNLSNPLISEFDAEVSSEKHNYSLGEYAGVNVDIPIVRSLHINTGLFWISKRHQSKSIYPTSIPYTNFFDGTRQKLDEQGNPERNNRGEPVMEYYHNTYDKIEFTMNLRGNYLEIPILASYRPVLDGPIGLQVDFGPYFAVGVNSKIKTSTSLIDQDKAEISGLPDDDKLFGRYMPPIYTEYIDFDLFKNNNDVEIYKNSPYNHGFKYWIGNTQIPAIVNRFDMGLHVGIGATVYKNLYIGAFYERGFINMLKKNEEVNLNDYTIHTSTFNINVGVNF